MSLREPTLVSIVVPVYNQADHIRARVLDYRQVLRDLQCAYELVLVTNGCRDNSQAVCEAMAKEFPDVRTINSILGGWGLAVTLGLREARGDLLGYTNSARTDGITLRQALDSALAHPRTVIKVRRSARGAWRKLGSMLYNLECRVLFGLKWGDVNGTPKFFPRAFDKLLHLQREDDLIDAEFSLICSRNHYPLLEVPVVWGLRSGGKSTTKLSSAIKMYRGAFELARAARRDAQPSGIAPDFQSRDRKGVENAGCASSTSTVHQPLPDGRGSDTSHDLQSRDREGAENTSGASTDSIVNRPLPYGRGSDTSPVLQSRDRQGAESTGGASTTPIVNQPLPNGRGSDQSQQIGSES